MISPVFAQWDESIEPDVKINIEKEFDEDGNLVGVDTVKTWSWSGHQFSEHDFDSVMDHFSDHFEDFLPRNFDHFSFHDMPNGPPLHNFWEWNEDDSSAFSQLDEYFDESFFEDFQDHFQMPLTLNDWDFPGSDSAGLSFHDFGFLEDHFDEDFHNNFEDLQKRMQLYHEEHQKLIDKYFREPSQLEDLDPDEKPRQSIPLPDNNEEKDSREI